MPQPKCQPDSGKWVQKNTFQRCAARILRMVRKDAAQTPKNSDVDVLPAHSSEMQRRRSETTVRSPFHPDGFPQKAAVENFFRTVFGQAACPSIPAEGAESCVSVEKRSVGTVESLLRRHDRRKVSGCFSDCFAQAKEPFEGNPQAVPKCACQADSSGFFPNPRDAVFHRRVENRNVRHFELFFGLEKSAEKPEKTRNPTKNRIFCPIQTAEISPCRIPHSHGAVKCFVPTASLPDITGQHGSSA